MVQTMRKAHSLLAAGQAAVARLAKQASSQSMHAKSEIC